MDWTVAIERNREALRRILATLVAMARLASPLAGEDGSARRGEAEALAEPGEGANFRLRRHLHRAVLRLLRPAESAARRLVIIAARELVVTLPPPRRRKPKPNPTILRHGIGTGILMPRGAFVPPPLTPPLKGDEGSGTPATPSPSRGGVRGGGQDCSRVRVGFPLFDPLRRPPRPFRTAAIATPRISLPGFAAPAPVPVRHPPDPYDLIDAGRLQQRLAALAAALDDLPAQARRFARWRARAAARGETRKTARITRTWPLRPGRPPGALKRPVHDVHDLLNDIHGLAFSVLERPDTS